MHADSTAAGDRMSAHELCCVLEISRQRLSELLDEGLPHGDRDDACSAVWFDDDEVTAWLLKRGNIEKTQLVARLADVALYFDVSRRTVAYWKLGDDENADLGEGVMGVLQAAGKSVDDLDKDAEAVRARREFQRQAAGLESHNAERQRIMDERQALEAEYLQQRDSYNDRSAKLMQRQEAADEKLARAEHARAWLSRYCADPELLRRDAELAAARIVLEQQIKEQKKLVDREDRLRANLADAEFAMGSKFRAGAHEKTSPEYDRARAALNEFEASYGTSVRQQFDSLKDRWHAIELERQELDALKIASELV